MARKPSNVIPFLAPPSADDSIRPTGAPLPQVWEKFMQLEAPALSPSRQRSMKWTREKSAMLGDHPSVMFIKKWRWELLDRQYPPPSSTAHLHCWNLQRVYNWGSAAGISHGNPVELARFPVPKTQPKSIRNFAAAWPQILAAAKTDRERAFLGVLRYAGPRLEGALALTAADVIPDGRGYALSFNKARSPGSWATKPQKGGARSNRIIPARPELVPLLRRVLGLGPAKVGTGRGGWAKREVEFIFPFMPYQLGALRKRLGAELPLFFGPKNAFHVLRHSFAEEAHAGGVSKDALQQVLGHVSPETTDAYLKGLLGTRVAKDVFAGLDPPKGGKQRGRQTRQRPPAPSPKR